MLAGQGNRLNQVDLAQLPQWVRDYVARQDAEEIEGEFDEVDRMVIPDECPALPNDNLIAGSARNE